MRWREGHIKTGLDVGVSGNLRIYSRKIFGIGAKSGQLRLEIIQIGTEKEQL